MVNYSDITNVFKENKLNAKVYLAKYYKYEENKYYPDGKNVIFDFSKKEYEIAVWLTKTFNTDVYINPRINYPDGIKSSDYIFKKERWDLKTINGNGKRTFEDAIKNKEKQAHNFIIDISKSRLTISDSLNMINKIFSIKSTSFVKTIILKKFDIYFVLTKRNDRSPTGHDRS